MRTPKAATVRRAAAAAWIAAGVGYLAVEAAAAARVPGYAYTTNYVSDLGRPVSPLAWWMNAAFRVQGMAFVAAGAAAVWAVRPRRGGLAFIVFACLYGAGSVVVGLFPSGGSGTWQALHAWGATAAIVGGNLAVLAAGRAGLPDDSRPSQLTGYALGGLGLLCGASLVCDRPAHRRLRARGDLFDHRLAADRRCPAQYRSSRRSSSRWTCSVSILFRLSVRSTSAIAMPSPGPASATTQPSAFTIAVPAVHR